MRLSAIGLMLTLALGMLVAPLAAHAQQPKNVPRIGLLLTNSHAAEATNIEAFRHGLHELGYVEGQTIMDQRAHLNRNLRF